MPLQEQPPTEVARSTSGKRLARRPRIRFWVAAAALVPLAVLAIPRAASVPPVPQPPGAQRLDPAVVLSDFWRAFEGASESPSIDSFDRWVETVWDDPVGPAALFPGRASIRKEGAGRRVMLDGPGFAGRGELTVQPRRWAATEYALASEDLSCVLCHVHIDGPTGPASAWSGSPPADHRGKQVSITGGLVAGSEAGLFDDSGVDLAALRIASGSIGAAQGRLVPLVNAKTPPRGAAPAPAGGQGAPVFIADRARGHLELIGDDTEPIQINGNLVVEGDLLLRGAYRGDGVIFVDGNVYLPGGLRSLDDGRLTLVALGSVLVGDVLRPRYDESLAVTGGPEGSFGFLLECLARFNFTRGERPPLGWAPGQAAYRLNGPRATGDWYDPALKALISEAQPAGPALLANGEPWIDHRALRESVGISSGLTLDATVLTPSAFIAVASGLRTVRERPASNPSRIAVGAVPRGAMLVRGSIASAHAAIHAPSGLRMIDGPVPRSMLGEAYQGGIEATVESISGEGSSVRSMGSGAMIPGLSVKRGGTRARLPAPSETRPAPGR